MAGTFTDPVLVAQAQTAAPPAAEATHAPEAHLVAGEEAHAEVGHAAPAVFPPFNPEHFASQILWLAITFGVLYAVVSRVALPRIGAILEQRKGQIDADLREAEALQKRTDAAVADFEAKLAQARASSHAIAEETRQGIRADIDARRKAVEADLAAKLGDAEARIRVSKTGALTQVDEIAASTAREVVGLLGGDATPEKARAAVARATRASP
jgi:F-type H+-transporting ATPase subunit b